MATPPPVGRNASVKITPELYDGLTAMCDTGMSVSDAIRSAVLIVSGIYRKAWDAGAVPHGTRCDLDRFFITRCDPGQWPARGSVQTHVPSAYRLPAPPSCDCATRPTGRVAPLRTNP